MNKSPEELGKKVANRAVQQLNAKSPKGGKSPVVLGPNVWACLCMKRLGIWQKQIWHFQAALLASNMGKKIGSDLVTFYDDGTITRRVWRFQI